MVLMQPGVDVIGSWLSLFVRGASAVLLAGAECQQGATSATARKQVYNASLSSRRGSMTPRRLEIGEEQVGVIRGYERPAFVWLRLAVTQLLFGPRGW